MTALACDQLQQQLNNQPDIDLVADFGDNGHDENILVLCTPEHLLIQFDKFHLSRQQSSLKLRSRRLPTTASCWPKTASPPSTSPCAATANKTSLKRGFPCCTKHPIHCCRSARGGGGDHDPLLHCDEHMSDVDPDEQDTPRHAQPQPVTQPPAPRKPVIKRGPAAPSSIRRPVRIRRRPQQIHASPVVSQQQDQETQAD